MENKKIFKGDDRKTPLWDAGLPEEERIKYLLEKLTLEEKFQCLGTGNPELVRFGIPGFGVGGEGAHGVQARHDQRYDKAEPCYTTVFPNPIGMSATWDRELIRQAGDVVGKEARALYHSGRHRSLSLWAPTVDLNRDPRWGRLEECYGEDGYLTGEMAGAYVDGMQGDHETFLQCAATAKHFYANNQEEGRTYLSSSVDWRNKYEYYLEPFRRLIQEHRLEGVMAAYNEVNGVPCMLLEKDFALLKSWGLGHVVCDGGDVGQTVDFHKYFSRHSETIAAGLGAHVDCFTDDIQLVSEAAREGYEHGMITEEDMDRALYSYFRTMLRLGFFDRDGKNPYTKVSRNVVSCRAHRELARKVTAESVVLLKNEPVSRILPERETGKERREWQDNKLLPLCRDKIAQGRETLAVIGTLCDTWDKGWYSGQPLYGVTPWQGIREAVYGSGQENGHLLMETGICEVKIKVGWKTNGNLEIEKDGSIDSDGEKEWYLGILPDSVTVGAVSAERAEIFLLDQWQHGKATLRAKSLGKLLTVKDDESLGEQGNILAVSDEAFGWFVREVFHITEKGVLTTWDHVGLSLDERGQLRKETMCPGTATGEYQGDDICSGNTDCSLSWEFEVVKDGIQSAVKVAKKADKVVVCLGSHPMITCKEEIDRIDLNLAEYQQELLEKVTQANADVILVLLSSVPLAVSWAQERVPAIVTMATGSMELGRGLADVLFGEVSPSGRLNITWYQSEKDLPPMEDYDVIQGGRTYQYFKGKPLYPFGYGLTYTPFAYGDFHVVQGQEYTQSDGRTGDIVVRGQENKIRGERARTVLSGNLTIKNTGHIPSDEVVQIYARKIDSELKRPEKALVYFERLKDVEPGEERRVSFTIQSSQLEYYDVISGRMILEPGSYELMAGSSSEDIRQRVEVSLPGEKRGTWPEGRFIPADCFATAVNHVLRRGHLSYQAVCTRNDRDEIVLTYDRIQLCAVPEVLVLDFWQEYHCDIFIETEGEIIGNYQIESPFLPEESSQEELTKRKRQEIATQAGEATGEGSFESHQNWLTRRREIGFREIEIPLQGEKIPTREPFSLTIRWRGRGKLCMFRFQ